jgi:hypothetical protein
MSEFSRNKLCYLDSRIRSEGLRLVPELTLAPNGDFFVSLLDRDGGRNAKIRARKLFSRGTSTDTIARFIEEELIKWMFQVQEEQEQVS